MLRPDERRQQIVDSAIVVIAEDGFAATRIVRRTVIIALVAGRPRPKRAGDPRVVAGAVLTYCWAGVVVQRSQYDYTTVIWWCTGAPVTDVPGQTPRSPLMVDGPTGGGTSVTAGPASTP